MPDGPTLQESAGRIVYAGEFFWWVRSLRHRGLYAAGPGEKIPASGTES